MQFCKRQFHLLRVSPPQPRDATIESLYHLEIQKNFSKVKYPQRLGLAGFIRREVHLKEAEWDSQSGLPSMCGNIIVNPIPPKECFYYECEDIEMSLVTIFRIFPRKGRYSCAYIVGCKAWH